MKHGQIPSGHPLMIFEFFPTPMPEASAVKSTLQYLYHIFNDFLSGLFLFGGSGGGDCCHRSLEIFSFLIMTWQLLILLQKKLHGP